MTRKANRPRNQSLRVESLEDRTNPAPTPDIRNGWEFQGPKFTDNPPTPILVPANPGIAAGKFHTLTVANAQLQWRSLPAGTPTQQSLATFFGAPTGTILSTARVAHDPYADRYLVAVIANHVGNNTSQLFLGVSDNQDPNGTWHKFSVQMTNSVGGTTFGQYLGLAVDEEAVYLTSSQYTTASGGSFVDARVVIVNKTEGTGGGWYGGGTPTVEGIFDPDTNAANDTRYEGLVPAQMYNNPTAPGAAVGTYFVAYNGLNSGVAGNEAVQIVRVDNPLTAPTFDRTFLDVGDVDDTSSGLPIATQPGASGIGLDLGPRRIGNAVWRDNTLYFATTVRTAGGLAAAHWFQVDTATPAPTVEQHGNVDTAGVAANLHAYHPSIAVDAVGDVGMSFTASNASNQALGYYTGRTPNLTNDPVNTMRAPELLPNQDTGNEYVRRVGALNPWGHYSAITVAANDRVFWSFNAYAADKDTTATEPDQGRWATAAGAFAFNWPPDVIDPIDSFSVSEDAPAVSPLALDSHFSDLENGVGANLSYSVVGNDNPTLVQAVISADGHSVEFTLPTPDANGLAFITVRATDLGTSDGPPAFTDTSFVLTVIPVNDAPTANPDSYNVDEDDRIDEDAPGVLSNDTDIDGDGLEVLLVAGPSAAQSFTLRPDGSFTYIPLPDFSGTDTFTYRANDGLAQSPLPGVTVTITVNGINDAPTAQPDLFTTPEDVALNQPIPGVKANDTDVDSPGFTVQLDQGPIHGDVTLNPDGSFLYTPDADYNGPDAFTYTATDGQATTAPVTVGINVTPVDDAPRPVDDTFQVAEGGSTTIPAPGVLANDLEVDGEALSIVSNTQPTNGQLTFNTDGSFTYTPIGNFSGTDTFTYTVTDGTTPVTATVTLNVVAVDNPPVASPDAYSTSEDTTLNVPAPGVLGNDSDIDSPTFTAELVAGPLHAANFNLSPNGSFTYTPALNFFGLDSFTYRAADATGPGNTVTVVLRVTPAQDPVNANDDGPIAVAGKPVRINVLSNDSDPDGDVLRVQSYSAPGKGRITRSGNALIYTPKAGASGPDSFTYVVSDGHGNTDTATVSLSLTDVVKPTVSAVRLGFGNRQADLIGLTRSVLPWTGITSVSVVFSEDVNPVTLAANGLTIGTSSGNLPTTFTYDAATRTGTWALNTSFTGIGRMSLRLSAAGVVDLSGNVMARDWSRTIGILPGDFDGNRVVNDADIKAVKKWLNKVNFFADLDGSGIVDQADLDLVTNNKGKRLL